MKQPNILLLYFSMLPNLIGRKSGTKALSQRELTSLSERPDMVLLCFVSEIPIRVALKS